MSNWQEIQTKLEVAVDALNLTVGDVINYTVQIEPRMGNGRERNYTVRIDKIESYLAYATNVKTGKTTKVMLTEVKRIVKVGV